VTYINLFLLSYFLSAPVSIIYKKKNIITFIESTLSIILIIIGLHTIVLEGLLNNFKCIIWGLFYLPAMILMTSANFSTAMYGIRLIKKLPEYYISFPRKAIVILLQTFKEELIWRCSFVHLMGEIGVDKIYIAGLGSLLFYLIHWSGERRFILLVQIELFLFSVILYTVYLCTASIFAVWMLHFIRNLYIKFYRSYYY